MVILKSCDAYHRGLAQFGVVFMELIPETKRPKHGWDYYDIMHRERGGSRLDKLHRWLQDGGALFRPAGGLWVLDCDDQETTQYAKEWLSSRGLQCPQVATPSGGCHFFFRFPEAINVNELKAHVCRAGGKRWDFKLGERTAIVLAGTQRKGKLYRPLTSWQKLPIIDPRELEPTIQIFKDRTPFLTHTGSRAQRRFAAKGYLFSCKTKPAIAGKGGHKMLANIACNLTQYYCQDPHAALELLLWDDPKRPGQTWNQRCQSEDGAKYPWSRDELWCALQDSVCDIPSLGKDSWSRMERKKAVNVALLEFKDDMVRQLLQKYQLGERHAWVHTSIEYWRFMRENGWSDDPPICIREFSTFLRERGLVIGRRNSLSAVFYEGSTVLSIPPVSAPLRPN